MARPFRIELFGGLYHVTSRGDHRESIYAQDADRLAWLALLGEVCKRFNWVCHAYCQMTNHYHAVLQTAECNLSQGMRQLNGIYTQYVNRTYSGLVMCSKVATRRFWWKGKLTCLKLPATWFSIQCVPVWSNKPGIGRGAVTSPWSARNPPRNGCKRIGC